MYNQTLVANEPTGDRRTNLEMTKYRIPNLETVVIQETYRQVGEV